MTTLARAYTIEPTARPVVPTGDALVLSDDLLKSFIRFIDRKPITAKSYLCNLRKFAGWLAERDIERPTWDDISEYRDHLAACGYKAGTQNQYLRAVKALFKWTAAKGIYPNVADNVHGARVDNSTPKREPVPANAMSCILDSIDRTTEKGKRLYAMFMLCIIGSLRTVELSRANVGDLKVIGGRTWFFVWGKRHDEPDDKIFLVPAVEEAVREYLDARTEPVTPKSPLFTSTGNRCGTDASGKPTRRISTNTISADLKLLLKANGYDSDLLTAHSTRHGSITAGKKAGLDLYTLQHMARHQSPTTTEIYIHEDDGDAMEITGRMAIYNYIFNGKEVTPVMPELQAEIEAMSIDEQRELLETIKAAKGGE